MLAKVHFCEKLDCLPALQTVITDSGGVVHERGEGLDPRSRSVAHRIGKRKRGVVRILGRSRFIDRDYRRRRVFGLVHFLDGYREYTGRRSNDDFVVEHEELHVPTVTSC